MLVGLLKADVYVTCLIKSVFEEFNQLPENYGTIGFWFTARSYTFYFLCLGVCRMLSRVQVSDAFDLTECWLHDRLAQAIDRL